MNNNESEAIAEFREWATAALNNKTQIVTTPVESKHWHSFIKGIEGEKAEEDRTRRQV